MNVLIVDDEQPVRDALSLALRLSGLNSSQADCGEAALAMIRNGDSCFHLILLDVDLPDLSGFEVLRHLRQNETTRDIPIIMLTGRNEIEAKATALALGANDYICKPFELDDFRDSVRRCLALSMGR